jgi:zinc D-Ala-D-Ala carboxypeptidase
MNLTPHFTLQEMTVSQTAVRMGINNTPNARQITNLTRLCENILEPFRAMVGKPINISSGFRNPTVNSLVGGSSTSQHMKGEATDFTVEGLTVQQLFDLIRTSALPYDQLIQEFDSWVHVSFGPRNRRQSLIFTKNAQNKTVSRPA